MERLANSRVLFFNKANTAESKTQSQKQKTKQSC